MFTVWVEHKYKRRTKKIFRKVNIIQDEKQARSLVIGENGLRLHVVGGGGP